MNKSPEAVTHAALAIRERFDLLISQPEIGRPLGDDLDLRELLIEFGDSGYVALYRYDNLADVVYVLAFRHQKEAGY
nr:type II toxin-antitoxin system RelE/ParE family toxin [Geoalkalibacter subterraneus]